MAARFLVLALLLASMVSAQPVHFGELTALTPTRYMAFGAEPVLASNGRDLFVFWCAGHQVRVTRHTGEPRAGRAVLDADPWTGIDAAWTGSGFIVIGSTRGNIVARVLDANGEPVGPQFFVVKGDQAQLAVEHGRVAILYRQYTDGRGIVRVLVTDRYAQANGATPVLIAERSNSLSEYAIAANGNGFTVLAVSQAEVTLTSVTAAGTISAATRVFGASTSTRGAASIGTNGHGFLAAWAEPARLIVQLIDSSGVAGRTVAIDAEANDARMSVPSEILWNHGVWELAYRVTLQSNNAEIRRVRMDPYGVIIGRDVPWPASPYSGVAAAVFDGRIFLSWSEADPGGDSWVGPLVVQDMTTGHESTRAAFASADQTVRVTAASASGLLVVWREVRTDRAAWIAGVRTSAGAFIEHEIGVEGAGPSIAASDGYGFAIVDHQPGFWSAVILGARGEVIGRSRPVESFYARAIASNGDGYVVAGTRRTAPRDIVAVRVSANGTVGEPVVIVPYGQAMGGSDSLAALVSDGKDYLAVWERAITPYWTNWFGTFWSIHALRFDASLRHLDAQPMLVSASAVAPVVSANEKGWTVVYSVDSRTESRVLTIDPKGAISSPARFPLHDVQALASFGDGTIVAASASGTLNIVRFGSFVTYQKEFGEATERRQIVRIPGGRVAYVTSRVERDAPYHGSDRIAIAFGDVDPLPPRPAAPRVTARIANSWAVIDWTPPPQRVTGYRVEYRVGDGSWNEIEASLDPTSRSVIALQPKTGLTYAFRVRALNDAGPGAYSEPVTLAAGRRQVVRR